jgi:hypothetical protein
MTPARSNQAGASIDPTSESLDVANPTGCANWVGSLLTDDGASLLVTIALMPAWAEATVA